MTQVEAPKVVRKKLFSPIWLLPLVALALGAWLGIKSIKESGVEIQIHFPNATGIDVGKTLVKYQGLTVGKVIDIGIDEELRGVNVKVLMDYRSAPFLKVNTLFWLVTPKASITGVEGLDALFSGNYIAIQPGDGDSETFFEASREAPAVLPGSEGMLIELSSDRLGSIDVGSPIFFRQVPVGNVVAYRLESNKRVIISAFIQEQFSRLIKKDTRFWNVSGVQVDASFSGVKVSSESLASLLAGGIAFNSTSNPDLARNGDSFPLYDSETLALTGTEFELVSDTAEGVSPGTVIIYRGIEIGEITEQLLTLDGVKFRAKLNREHSELLTGNARFWLEGADISLNGIKHPQRFITGAVINFLPGVGAAKPQYTLVHQAPDLLAASKLKLRLSSEQNFGLSVGSEVRYKNFAIGKITDIKLSNDFSSVEYQVEILPEFRPLLTRDSFFVPQRAVSVDASLDGINIAASDLKSMMTGAIDLHPGMAKHAATADKPLPLYASAEAAERIFARQKIKHVTLLSQDGADLGAGAPVYYKKMQIGQVEAIDWLSQGEEFRIRLAIDKAFTKLLKPNAVFWRNSAVDIDASLSGVKIAVAPLQGALKGSVSLGLLDDAKQGNQSRLYESEELALALAHPISLTFPASVKLAANAAIRYRGHQVGVIQQVRLNKDLQHVTAQAYLYGDYADYFTRSDSQYVIVDAQISLREISAPETLITGPYVSAFPGEALESSQAFIGSLSSSVYANVPQDALKFTLKSANLGSTKAGTPIFYRGIPIGQVDGYALSDTGNCVLMQAHIEPQYAHLVNLSSQFWELSGIRLDAGLFSGIQLETGSLETILAGGIGVVTRHSTNDSNRIKDESEFDLQDKARTEWQGWALGQ
jgi:paraquat-inducible protein B